MSNLTPILVRPPVLFSKNDEKSVSPINNALMQPVYWNGQVYFTSHYFHQMYKSNVGGRGKHRNLGDFNVLIRSIESYEQYVNRGDIMELRWIEVKEKEGMEIFHPLFKATSFNPFMLINATAQVALTHHLDDEISKQISVRANESVAKRESKPYGILDVPKNHRARLQLARMCGLKGPQAQFAANDWTKREDGVDVLGSLGIKSITSDNQSQEISATEIGEELGVPGNGQHKAVSLNLLLWDLGYLETFLRRSRDGKRTPAWRISDKGIKSKHLEYGNVEKPNGDSSSIQAIKYHRSILDVLNKIDIDAYDFKALSDKRKEANAA